MMILTFIKERWFALLYLAIYFIAINLVVLNRFWQYEAFYYDHGIYDSALWQVAHLQIPYIDHLEAFPIRQFGDHFTPTMYLLTPIYWLTSAYEPILIVQNLLVVVSALIILIIAEDKTKNKLMSFAIVFAFTFFIGLQNFLISNFHADGVAILTLAITFLAIEKKRWKLFWLGLLLTLGAKQNFSAIGVGIGIYLILSKTQIKTGFLVVILSVIYYFLATNVFIPTFGLRPYWYKSSLTNPLDMAKNIFLPVIKTQTILASVATFGFLPVFYLAFIPTIFQDFFTRFVINLGPARWDLGLHYNATLAIILAYGAVLGVNKLMSNKFYKKIVNLHAIAIIVIVLFLHQFAYHGPLGLAFNRDFYRHTKDFSFLNSFIKNIPNDGLVMTQNNIAPQITHTHNIVLLRENYEDYHPDVVAFDARSGQNINDYWPLTPYGFNYFQYKISQDPSYKLLSVSTKDQRIYVKVGSQK